MEKPDVSPHPRGLAAGLTAGIVYIICAAAVTLWPAQSLRFVALWLHGIDLTKIAAPVQLTVGKFVLGLFGVVLSFYILGVVYGLLYNLCYAHCKRKKWI